MQLKIGKKIISQSAPAFIIAELSANHNQDFKVAAKTIEAIKQSGADAVKIQTYTADTLTLDSDLPHFKINQGTIWDKKTFYELYKEAHTPWEWQPRLKKIAEDLGLIFFSSPFDLTAVDFLEKMKVPAYKIASFEITDHALIEYVAKQGKPVIISTGIAKKKDIEDAIRVCKKAGNKQIALLKCTSAYPTAPEEMNLKTLADMSKRFKVIVGLSDHSEGSVAPITSIALGAKIIEKHFILDKKIGGPDAEFSMEPVEFKKMVEDIRVAEKTLGKVSYELTEKTKKSRGFARSLFVVKEIKKGEIFTSNNIRSIRPNLGVHPKYLKAIIGKKSAKDLKPGEPMNLKYISKS